MSDNKTFYKQLVNRWQNNKLLAYSVLLIGAVVGGIAAYNQVSDFASDVYDRNNEIIAFNKTVQPIYFEFRSASLVPGQDDYISEMASKIIEIQPEAIILHSHTSRVQPLYNVPISRRRGAHVADFLIRIIGCEYEGEFIVVPRGGAEANGQDAGYEQRVDVEMTNDAKGVAGVRVRRNPASC